MDVYLPAAITTPYGTTDTLRVTILPGGVIFFTPQFAPEPSGTRGNAAAYTFWPLKRETVRSSATSKDDKLTLTASNVTGEWATMLAAVEWRDAGVVIRKVPTSSSATLTASDCAPLFVGRVDAARITLETVSLQLSNDLGTFDVQLPRQGYHPHCRFRWADDGCGAMRWHADHYKAKTAGSGSSTLAVVSSDWTEDLGSAGSYGTDLVASLANGDIVASTVNSPHYSYRVRSGDSDYWGVTASRSWWGDLTEGYYLLPDAQAGIANAALQPYITFDFGSAKTCRLWRITGVSGYGREPLPRNLLFFSSPDNSTWTHEAYFECPAIEGLAHEVRIPKASSARYWRICLRTRWAAGVWTPVFAQVEAYENGRHWWRDGVLKFGAATTTVALRGVSRRVAASYSGTVTLTSPLPALPVAGDTFTVERGCGRTFNDCGERRRTEFFGGFPEIGIELTADASGTTQTAPAGGSEDGTGTGGRLLP